MAKINEDLLRMVEDHEAKKKQSGKEEVLTVQDIDFNIHWCVGNSVTILCVNKDNKGLQIPVSDELAKFVLTDEDRYKVFINGAIFEQLSNAIDYDREGNAL